MTVSAAPPVSICLLTFNRASLLQGTLDSLLSQSFSDFELIISDDCSTDQTEQVCQRYAQYDSRIRYVRQPYNLGMPGNLNACLQLARGKYLANLHDGDIYRHDLIDKWVSALDTYPTAGIVFNSYLTEKNGREILSREPFPPLIPGRVLGKRLLSRWGSCVYGTVMARREAYETVGWFDPKFANYADVDMWMRIALHFDITFVDEPLIRLMSKDPSRFYYFIHWRVIFWILGIHALNLRRYSIKYSGVFDELIRKFPRRKRSYLLWNMLLCMKHRRFDRVREGFAIWRDADDLLLASIGRLAGRSKDIPKWYHASYWTMTSLLVQ